MERIEVVRLTQDFIFADFDCGEDDLNDFLLNDAKNYLKYLISVTYILRNSTDIVGYFSVSNDRISFEDSDKATWRRIRNIFPHRKHRKDYPAVKIGRLAINKKYQGSNYGREILFGIKQMFTTNNRTGCCFVTVDALPSAIGFYEKNGFRPLLKEKPAESVTIPMYFDLTTLLD
ncbi:MAG: GNAT family N-acetyltransferase [Bacteroidales bacterium]|nr:GNAT family N-acetyltransferase [Bacteroidales bacterium]